MSCSVQTTTSVSGQCSLQEHVLLRTDKKICLKTEKFTGTHASPYRQEDKSLDVQFARTCGSPYKQLNLSLESVVCKNTRFSIQRATSATEDQLDACQTGDQVPALVQHRSFVEIDHDSFLTSFSPFHCFKKGSCQLLAKECALSTC